MSVLKSRRDFLDTEEGKDVVVQLKQMVSSDKYNTNSTYNSNSELYPDNLISFVDKHINYLITHPNLDSAHYLANIKIVTKVR